MYCFLKGSTSGNACLQALARADVLRLDTVACGPEGTPPGSLTGATSRLSLAASAPVPPVASGRESQAREPGVPGSVLQRCCLEGRLLTPAELAEADPSLAGARLAYRYVVRTAAIAPNRSLSSHEPAPIMHCLVSMHCICWLSRRQNVLEGYTFKADTCISDGSGPVLAASRLTHCHA